MTSRIPSKTNTEGNAPKESSAAIPKGRSWGESYAHSFFHTTLGPLFIMSVTPLTIIFAWIICTKFDGSVTTFYNETTLDKLLSWEKYPKPSLEAAKLIVGFAAMEAFFQAVLPGKTFYGPVTRTGNRPRYILNGVLSFFATHIVLYVFTIQLKWFSLSIVYDNFGSILNTLSLSSFIFCIFLYIKGLYFPSSQDQGTSGNFVMDFYWGTELHPQIGTFNIKQFSNCRFGMMSWSVIINCFLIKQYEELGYVTNSMIISTFIQQFYILKFFYWEDGYFNTLDIMYDRLGYYIYWGVTCWIPGIYCLVSEFLVSHPITLSTEGALAITILGIVSVICNYDADIQRQRVRETNGNCFVWGAKPKVIVAKYTTSDGQKRESLLLCSGWWGITRHIHYIPEILLSVAWTAPAGFDYALPWFYVFYLIVLLVHRLGRDEVRCREKYGTDWKKYCEQVPYQLIPYVF